MENCRGMGRSNIALLCCLWIIESEFEGTVGKGLHLVRYVMPCVGYRPFEHKHSKRSPKATGRLLWLFVFKAEKMIVRVLHAAMEHRLRGSSCKMHISRHDSEPMRLRTR